MRGAFDRLRAAVYGQAVGDALGVPYEFRPRDMFRCVGMTGYGTHNRPAGTWSDDTSMMLATLDSLAANDWHVDVDDMRARFLSWLDGGEYAIDGDVFDRGVTVATALRRGEGATGFYDNGNGSLMRIMPLAFADCGAGDAGCASAITHAHPVSRRCCVAWVTLLRNALEGAGLGPYGERARRRSRDSVRSGGFVGDTFEAALWCAATTDNYRDCVLAAVNLGGDADTTAAVTGGLAGILYGFEAIPGEWLDSLRGGGIIEAVLGRARETWRKGTVDGRP